MFVVQAGGEPVPALSLDGALPDGLAFTDNGDGTATIAGTPAAAAAPAGSSAVYPLTLRAAGAAGAAAQAFALTVVSGEAAPTPPDPGGAPSFAGSAVGFAVEGRHAALPIELSGSPAPSLRLEGSPPEGMRLVRTGSARWVLRGKPTKAGTTRLTAIARNSAGVARRDLKLVVERAAKLTRRRVRVDIGRRARHRIRVRAPKQAKLRCRGSLPRGARCRARGNKILIVVSPSLRRTGNFWVTVHVATRGGTVKRHLQVRIRRHSSGS